MKCKVYKAYPGSPKSTITLSKKNRESISKEYGIQLKPGYAAKVIGSQKHCPRNLVVQRMRKMDTLLNKSGVARLGATERKRLGVKIGDTITVIPLNYEVWYHGTRAQNPLNQIVNGEWIVGGAGSGIWMSDLRSMAREYAYTGLFTLHVAWGKQLIWPLPQDIAEEFKIWCSEHDQDFNTIINNPGQNWQLNPDLLRWARLYGHYLIPYPNARIFPGVTGEKFIGNRVRIIKIETPDGIILWQR
jgi:hypothetical protein